jgi:hypothetical protein
MHIEIRFEFCKILRNPKYAVLVSHTSQPMGQLVQDREHNLREREAGGGDS